MVTPHRTEIHFSQSATGEVERLCSQLPSLGREPERLLHEQPALPAVGDLSKEVLAKVRRDGWALVRATSPSPTAWRLGFAALGLSMAEPILRYDLLYPVRDRGGSYRDSAIPVSMTRSATGLHTDSSAWDCIPGIIGLLCERPSLDGGWSLIGNAERACEWLRQNHPRAFHLLRQPYLRDLVTPGVEKTDEARRRNRFPVLQVEPEFQLRYMRYWIEKGHERMGEPLAPQVLKAFDALDRALAHPEWTLRFSLDAGQMLFLDNRRFVHGRESYGDVPEGGRLLWRMWLDERASRPLAAHTG